MASIEQDKLRLLRGAVQDNVDLLRGIRTHTRSRHRKIEGPWIWSPFLLAVLAILWQASPVISTRPAATPQDSTADIKQAQAMAQLAAPEVQTPALTPHPLDRAVIPLGINRIVIDAGHGGKQPGAISESGVSEKDITLDIALRVHRLLDKAPFEVLMTRQDDRTMTLEKRVAFANSNRADLFISIHINWTEPREIRPLETYFVGPSDDPATIKLASMENQESGYSLSEYRRVLEKIYIDTRRDESRNLAKNIHAELYQALKAVNPTLDNRGVRTAPFLVLVGTEMPAILLEVSTLSNEEEVELLIDPDYREKIALAVSRGIGSYANNLNRSAEKGS
ncbi:MAG TPA: N-acetylmuramoyl-L-alanine amidase [Candidatus Binatia bacterium]|nr:N-acetylmuramoyl-L-alanine amidase [Candidatus Binatia bacterium]